MEETTPPAAQYRIGAVSRLTGIPTVTIRMWERRYAVTDPDRSPAGDRLYSDSDVRKLSLLKLAVDNDNSISNVAKLSESQLDAIVGHASIAASNYNEPVRIAVVGSFLVDALDDTAQLPHNVIIANRTNITDSTNITNDNNELAIDVVAVEIPLLDDESFKLAAELRQRYGARYALVIYQFGTQKVVDKLSTLTIQTIRAPVSPAQLARSCVAITHSQPSPPTLPSSLKRALNQPLPKKRFNDKDLAKFSKINTLAECECPAHMTDIIRSLQAFENYSAQCENSNSKDIAMHQVLHLVTAQARMLMEDAMQVLIEHEHELDSTQLE